MTDTTEAPERIIRWLDGVTGCLEKREPENGERVEYVRADLMDRRIAEAVEAERSALRSLVSVVIGYQKMPGFSLHPMVEAQIAAIRSQTEGEGNG